MTRSAKNLLQKALKLPPGERLELAKRLRASVEGSGGRKDEAGELSAEWLEEIERRVAGILSGRTKGIPAKKAFAKLRRNREEYGQRRGQGSAH